MRPLEIGDLRDDRAIDILHNVPHDSVGPAPHHVQQDCSARKINVGSESSLQHWFLFGGMDGIEESYHQLVGNDGRLLTKEDQIIHVAVEHVARDTCHCYLGAFLTLLVFEYRDRVCRASCEIPDKKLVQLLHVVEFHVCATFTCCNLISDIGEHDRLQAGNHSQQQEIMCEYHFQ